jgi:predicted nucleic acid-binding protein
MVVCADTSFLFSLYGNDSNSPKAITWSATSQKPIMLSALNDYELGNALKLAEFRKTISPGDASVFWSQFESDLANGRLVLNVCNLAEVLNEARRLSATHSLRGGHRAFDILHVAAALHMRAEEFLTFDRNQKLLAGKEGLRTPL